LQPDFGATLNEIVKDRLDTRDQINHASEYAIPRLVAITRDSDALAAKVGGSGSGSGWPMTACRASSRRPLVGCIAGSLRADDRLPAHQQGIARDNEEWD
jgi:hypothetical protein